MSKKNHKYIFQSSLISVLALTLCAATAAQVTQTAPAHNPNITAPGPQRHQAPSQPQTQLPGTRAPQPIMQAPGNGTIEGFVYWDTGTFTHTPASSCAGLSLTVSVANGLGGPFKGGFTPLPTVSNNFKYVGHVTTAIYAKKRVVYDVCTYGYDHLPVGPQLKVEIGFAGGRLFWPIPASQPSILGPITIINGQCNMLPHITNPTFSDLTAHWGSCQNMAFNVNFVLQDSKLLQIQSANAGGSSPSSQGTQRGMLSSAPPQGMLATANTQGSQSSAKSGTVLGNQQPMPGQTGGVQSPESKVELNPQPFPPRVAATGATANPGANASLNLQPVPPGPSGRAGARKATLPANRRMAMTLASPKQSRTVSNPKSALQNAGIIAVLQNQSQNAAAEASAMKLGIRSVGVQAGTTPSQTMAATAVGTIGAAPAPNQNGALASSMKRPALGAVLPSQFNTLALTCSHDPSMRVLTVSGGPAPVIFTPDPKYNFYTITGCSFGNPGTNSKAYIYYQGTFREDFQIQQWTDNFIQLSLDQNITDVDDQNNINFVVQRDDGKQWTKNGYKFYAARQTVRLSQIPKNYFSINQFRPDQSILSSWNPTYTSASSASVTPNLSGLSTEVHWDITTDPNGTVVGGSDDYDFGHLHSTFLPDSASMEYRDISCTDPNYPLAKSSNNWSLDWYGNSALQVSWQGQVCNPLPSACGNGVTSPECFTGAPESNYGIDVWVSGPRGLDPWTGKPLG